MSENNMSNNVSENDRQKLFEVDAQEIWIQPYFVLARSPSEALQFVIDGYGLLDSKRFRFSETEDSSEWETFEPDPDEHIAEIWNKPLLEAVRYRELCEDQLRIEEKSYE